MDLLHGVPVVVVAPAVVILGLVIIYVVLKALREGREVSFWPPKIGQRPSPESGKDSSPKVDSPLPSAKSDPYAEAMGSQGTLLRRPVTQTVTFPDNTLAFLYVESGEIRGVTFALTTAGRGYLFGKGEGCDFKLPGTSRAQFRIHLMHHTRPTPSTKPYDLHLQELGSTIPTWVDGHKVSGDTVELKDHSMIETAGLSIHVLKLSK